jgi:1,4-dihydroxy-2-naphthoyl-CoA hydrolase
MPFAADLGMRIESATADEVVGRLDWAPRLCTSAGVMHGGVLMSFADTLGAGVTFLGLPEGATTATITSTTQMFRPVLGGSVRGVAEIVHRGRTVVTAVTKLYDDNDKLVAQTTQIQAVRAASG